MGQGASSGGQSSGSGGGQSSGSGGGGQRSGSSSRGGQGTNQDGQRGSQPSPNTGQSPGQISPSSQGVFNTPEIGTPTGQTATPENIFSSPTTIDKISPIAPQGVQNQNAINPSESNVKVSKTPTQKSWITSPIKETPSLSILAQQPYIKAFNMELKTGAYSTNSMIKVKQEPLTTHYQKPTNNYFKQVGKKNLRTIQ